jgi:POT family proton-dependent oligopeptide transporter
MLGHLSIGLTSFLGVKTPFFIGLVLIVLGTGLLKPNISAIVGDLYPEGGARRDAGFSIFYMGINTGATAGQIFTGLLGEKLGYGWGFGIAGVGMLAGLIWYTVRAKPTLGDIGTQPSRLSDPTEQRKRENQTRITLGVGVTVLALVVLLTSLGVITIDPQVVGKYWAYFLGAIGIVYFAYIFTFGKLKGDEKKRVVVIAVLFVAAAIFWAAFEQAPTSLNLFAKDFTDRQWGSFEVPALWYQSINSFFIIIFAPVFAWLWLWLGKRNINISSPFKFALGLALAGVGFLIMIYPSNMLVAAGGAIKVSGIWLTLSYLLQTFGELSLSPVGLSSMTKLSPRRYVGQMMGIWFLATSLGNMIAGLVGGSVDPEKLEQTPMLFKWTTIALFASAAVLAVLSVPIARMMRNVEDEKPEVAEPMGPPMNPEVNG